MKHTTFAKRSIIIGNNVQFGQYCDIATDVLFGNNILIASRVCIVGRNDHNFDIPRVLIWNGDRKPDGLTIIEDDVWIGINSTIIAGVIIGKGSVIAAGSLVNKDIPSCEIWGGVPAKKIKNRFNSEEDKINHLEFLIGLAGN
jgi:acetyltransferase-like isoleucine patch superfamily enzyme